MFLEFVTNEQQFYNTLYVTIPTASFIIIGVTVFGLEVPDENWRLSWAFGLSAAAGVVYVGVFLTLTWTVIRRRSAPSLVVD